MQLTSARRSITLFAACMVFTRLISAQGLEWAHTPAQDLGLSGVAASGSTVAFFDDGSGPAVYVGGTFTAAGGVPALSVARWNGSSWSAVGAGLLDFTVSPNVSALLVHDDGTGPALYAGGGFSVSGSTSVHNVARWNGSAWTALGAGTLFPVADLVTFDDGTGPALYAGGSSPQVMRWNGTAWSFLPSFPLPVDFVTSLAVHTDASGSALYAGGIKHDGLGQQGFVARLQGTTWTEVTIFGGMTYCSIVALHSHDDGTGPALYAGGRYLNAGGTPARCIARRIGSTWEQVGQGFNEVVLNFLTYDDGTGPALYASGGFNDVVDGVGLNLVARWTPSGWSILGRGLGGSAQPFDSISCPGICVADLGSGADLYATGAFISAGGAPVHHFARWKRAADAGGPFCFGDGSGLACPCGNASTAVERAGCRSSFGSGGKLEASGQAHVASDSLVLTASQLPSASTVLFFQGTSRANHGGGVAMGDGLRCASGSMIRLGTKAASMGSASTPGVGGMPLHVAGNVTAGATRTYQAMYRNIASFCSPDTFNLTNGWIVGWSP